MQTRSSQQRHPGPGILPLAIAVLVARPACAVYEVAGSYWANAPATDVISAQQILPSASLLIDGGDTQGTCGNDAHSFYYANLATGVLGVDVSAFCPDANSYSCRGGSGYAEVRFRDDLQCRVPAGTYPDGVTAVLHGVVAGRLSAEGCEPGATPRCSHADHSVAYSFSGASALATYGMHWEVDATTSPLDVDQSFALTQILVEPGGSLLADEVTTVTVTGAVDSRVLALWVYPYGDPVTAADADFYGNGGITGLTLPDGVTCTSESGVFLSQPGGDPDGDGIQALADNCTEVYNPDQRDSNADGYGNVCDADLNNDCVINIVDLGLLRNVFFSADPDADLDGDGVVNIVDLGILRAAFFDAPGPSGVQNVCAQPRN